MIIADVCHDVGGCTDKSHTWPCHESHEHTAMRSMLCSGSSIKWRRHCTGSRRIIWYWRTIRPQDDLISIQRPDQQPWQHTACMPRPMHAPATQPSAAPHAPQSKSRALAAQNLSTRLIQHSFHMLTCMQYACCGRRKPAGAGGPAGTSNHKQASS